MSINETIVQAMTDLDEATLYAEVQKAVDGGANRLDILAALQQGMANVGNLFSERKYFLSELMLSAEMFGECQKIMGGEQDADAQYGSFVIGTVYGDVHDIGKNIVASVFRSSGFKVVDLGVDVQPAAFLEAIKANDPKVVGFSCLLTTGFPAMKDCIAQVRATGLDKGRLLMIGGGPVEQATLEFVDGDYLGDSVQDAVEKAIAFAQA